MRTLEAGRPGETAGASSAPAGRSDPEPDCTPGAAPVASRHLDNSALDPEFPRELELIGGRGARVASCVQCGLCTGGCPVAAFMDLTPRRLIRCVQLGLRERVLSAEALWLCTGCHLCTARCPFGVRVSEVIETLRNLAYREGRRQRMLPYPRLFVEEARRRGAGPDAMGGPDGFWRRLALPATGLLSRRKGRGRQR